jgi:hypothetical protein
MVSRDNRTAVNDVHGAHHNVVDDQVCVRMMMMMMTMTTTIYASGSVHLSFVCLPPSLPLWPVLLRPCVVGHLTFKYQLTLLHDGLMMMKWRTRPQSKISRVHRQND